MEIIIKIVVSIIAYFFLAVIGALAFSAPTRKITNEKIETIKQSLLFIITFSIALYFIWTF